MPFGFVQLANKLGEGTEILRWHQTEDIGYVPNKAHMENTFMAVALDTFENNPHPHQKQTVAKRLALAGARIAYKLPNYSFHDPFVIHSSIIKNRIKLTYDQNIVYNSTAEISGFYSCEVNYENCDTLMGSWMRIPQVQVSQKSANEIIIDIGVGMKITGLAYLWEDTPVKQYLGAPIYADLEEKAQLFPAVPWKKPVDSFD